MRKQVGQLWKSGDVVYAVVNTRYGVLLKHPFNSRLSWGPVDVEDPMNINAEEWKQLTRCINVEYYGIMG